MKKIILLTTIIFVTLDIFSQSYNPPSYADIDENYKNYVNNLFGPLEHDRVPTGLLMDYAFDFTDPKIYDGTVLHDSTLMEQGIYSELYKTIYTSRFNTNANGLIHPSLYDSLCYIARQKEVITLSGLLFKYNAFNPNALGNGTLQEWYGQLYDVYDDNGWQNPYDELNTVAVSPSITSYKLTYCSVVLPSNLWVGNMNNEISTIEFDADDGQGYRTLQFDSPIQLNYADTGWKHWVFRVNLNSYQQLYSHTKVHFNNTSNMAGSFGAAARGAADVNIPITATEQFNGRFGAADIVISYRNQNDPVIRKPLIVAEGFDPGHILNPEEPEGQNTFNGFINTVVGSNSITLQNQISGDPFILNSPSEYDIIYVNWRNGTDWLQRNELVLEEVIREVNRRKGNDLITGLRNPNVVLGSSMGGVIARMALGRMDRNGGFAAHETRLYVSLDAPHQGANVPLGYQAAARHATRLYISTGPIFALVEAVQAIRNGVSPLQATYLADQPAGRQLLIERINFNFNEDNADHQQFMQELQTQWAYPVNIRNVAISDGNECAIDQEFTPGSNLLYHYRSTKTRFIGDLIFMAAGAGLGYLTGSPLFTPFIIPGSNKFELTLDIRSLAYGGGNQVYYGNIKLTKKVLWLLPVSINIANRTYNAPGGLLPFDTYPGGFYTLTLANQPGSVSRDWMFSYDNSFFIQRRFAFIHTTSALDIGQGNVPITNTEYTARYIGATPPAVPFNTPFQNFTTSFNTDSSPWEFTDNTFRRLNNLPHEWLFVRNANWLAEELNGNVNIRTDCSVACGNNTITGADNICANPETYTINNLPAGPGVTWSTNPQSVATVDPAGTVTRQGNGVVTLTATINNCGNIATLTKQISVGAPYTSCYEIGAGTCYQNNAVCQLIGWQYAVIPGTSGVAGTGYHLQVNGGGYFTNGQTTMDITNSSFSVYIPNTGSNSILVWAMNSCGISNAQPYAVFFYQKYYGCYGGYYYRVSPNPAGSTVTVDEKEPEAGKAKLNKTITELNIYDQMGNVKKRKQFTKAKTGTINISDLKAGVYFIEIADGANKERQQLIIQR